MISNQLCTCHQGPTTGFKMTEVLWRSLGILGFFSSGSFGSRLESTIPRQPDGHLGIENGIPGAKRLQQITALKF